MPDIVRSIFTRRSPRRSSADPRHDNASVFGRVRRMISATAQRWLVTLAQVLSASREPGIVNGRWAALAAVCAAYPEASLKQLGRWFQRHHTTILHALKRMRIVHEGGRWRQTPAGSRPQPEVFA